MILRTLFLFPFLCSSLVFAGGVTLTPEGASAFALKHNPSLLAARLGIEEARGRLEKSGRLSNPELELEFNRNTRGSESATRVALLQRFPLTGRLRYEKAVSRALLAAAEFEFHEAERKLAAEVSGICVKLLVLREQRTLRSTQLENLQELARFQRKAAEAGEGSPTEALQVELEVRQMEIDRLQLAADEAVFLGEFRILLGSSVGESPVVEGRLPSPSAPASSLWTDRRPDVLAAQARADAARFSVKEQQARRVDDAGAGLSYGRARTIDAPNPIATDRVIGFRVTLPLPLWNSNTGGVYAAGATAARAQKELAAALLAASGETEAARQAMEAYAKIFTALDASALPQAAQLEEQLRASHARGQTPLIEVLRMRFRRLELQRQRLEVLREYHLARIRHLSASNQPIFSK